MGLNRFGKKKMGAMDKIGIRSEMEEKREILQFCEREVNRAKSERCPPPRRPPFSSFYLAKKMNKKIKIDKNKITITLNYIKKN